MSEAATPASEPLSVEQAIANITPEPETETAPEAPEPAAEEPEEIDAGDQPADEPEAEPEEQAEGEEELPAEAETLDPPLYWSPEAKADFAKLPASLQAVVLAQEGPREQATAKAKAEASAQVQAAQKDREGITALAEQLAEFLPQAVTTFQKRWGEPDWAQVAAEQGAETAFVLKAQYETEQKELSQLAQANQKAQAEAHKAFVQTEWRQLAEIAPDLAPDLSDPTKGAEKRQEVTKYLSDEGIPRESIAQISAREMNLARKAMLWDRAQAKLAAKPAPKPVTAPARASVRPAASAAQSSPQGRVAQVANRYAQTRSVDDAVALLLAKGSQ
jgi:hypothetical protein